MTRVDINFRKDGGEADGLDEGESDRFICIIESDPEASISLSLPERVGRHRLFAQ